MNLHLSAEEARLRRLARQLVDGGQWDAAHATLAVLARHVPDDVTVLVDLADVLFRRGRLREATSSILEVARRLPRDAELIIAVVKRLIAFGEVQAARSCLNLLAQAPSPPPKLLAAQAQLRFSIGEMAHAKALMDRAMAGGVESPGELQLHAMLLQFHGDVIGAENVLERCLKRWPQFGDAVMALVNLRKQASESPWLGFVQSQLRRLPANDTDPAVRFVRAEFEYARFKILDDLGRHEEAWPALAGCNDIMRELNPYDAAGETAVTEALMRMSLPVGQTREPHPGPVPIFIVGMPRSGTTLLDRMLSRHSAIASAGEIIDFWRQLHWVADVAPSGSNELLSVIQRSAELDYESLGSRYLRQTQWRARGRPFYVDKLPANIQMVGFIRRALPHAPILHMVRDPIETCFSNLKAMFGNISSYSYDQRWLAHRYGQYARLVRHWKLRHPGAMLDVSYASLVQDPRTTLRQVFEHCGLALEDDCLRPELNNTPVATPSSAQVREAVHTRSLGQWRNYEQKLRPLCLALDEFLGNLG